MGDEHFTAAACSDLVEVVVLVRAIGAALKEPTFPLAVHADAPSVAVFAREKRKASGSLFQG
jgi:hypothetical protein